MSELGVIEEWRGCSMDEIYRDLNAYELRHDKVVNPSETHAVLYHCPIKNNDLPPNPFKGQLKWDALHVRLPCSTRNQYPVQQNDGSTTIELRWKMIEKALLVPIKNSQELEKAIHVYNSKYAAFWKFHSLHKFFEEMDEAEALLFFEQLLPKIIQLALKLPILVPGAIPLLRQSESTSLSLSQQQISCLLANAFLCTFPRRNTLKRKSEYSSFPDINFNRLFQSTGQHVLEKLKCIFHYFRRVCNVIPIGVVTFTRRSVPYDNMPNWSKCDAPLGVTPLHVTSIGTIEDQGVGLLQVDFANKFLGGGVLGSGCVQEEIRFVICPELIISKLFTEALRPCEALLMIGAEQYSKYTGYASTFSWSDNFIDQTPFDESRRRQCHIVAIDALHFLQGTHQYQEELVIRELNKAYVGFIHPLDTPAPGVASGNWGCGAFGGDATLKALIQLMACTINKRPLVYFTFGNIELRDEFHKIHTFFIEENVKVNQLWEYLKEFGKMKLKANQLYEFIRLYHVQKRNNKLAANSRHVKPIKINQPPPPPPNNEMKRKPDYKIVANEYHLDDSILKELEKDFSSDECQTLNTKIDQTKIRISPDLFDMEDSNVDMAPSINIIQISQPDSDPVPKKVKSSNTQTEKTALRTNSNNPKQNTLIDMLDFFYTKS